MEPNQQTHDIRTFSVDALESPRKIKEDFIASRDPVDFVIESRNTISSLLSHRDAKHVVVDGPCSAQNETFAIGSTVAARNSPTFLVINEKSPTSALRTSVNEHFHIITLSGCNGSNYRLKPLSQIVKLSISSRIGLSDTDEHIRWKTTERIILNATEADDR